MWIVKNRLRGTLTLRTLGVSIGAGQEFDLDVLGRERAESSPQVAVAFEERYLENVYKQPTPAVGGPDESVGSQPTTCRGGTVLTPDELGARLDVFKRQFLAELVRELPTLKKLESVDLRAELEGVRKAIATDLREAVSDLRTARERIETEKRRVLADASLSESEMKARIAFLEEKERELVKNFETIGRTVERSDGDVMDKADLLSNL